MIQYSEARGGTQRFLYTVVAGRTSQRGKSIKDYNYYYVSIIVFVHECTYLDVDVGTSQQTLGEDDVFELRGKADTVYVAGGVPLNPLLFIFHYDMRTCFSVARSCLTY